MAATKEADIVSYQPPETLGVEQNGFARFLAENNEAFDRHSFLTHELRDEEEGWKNSPTIDSVVEKGVEVIYAINPRANLASGKVIRRIERQLREHVTKFIFGNSSEKDRLIANFFPQALSGMPRFTPEIKALSQPLTESLDDFRTSYHGATAPLVSGIRESKAELMGKFEDFLLSNPSNIFAFGDFLSDKKNHGAKIEAIRPFLSSLVDSEHRLAREKKKEFLAAW